MSITSFTFKGHRGRAEHIFTCPSCGRRNRKRTFIVEHTVNPFNRNGDGTVKTSEQVYQDAKAEAIRRRDEFLLEPLCRACEDDLSSAELTALNKRREKRYADAKPKSRKDAA